ncbi:hypothetical protein BsWGS_17703 [Bradybaena similaris]
MWLQWWLCLLYMLQVVVLLGMIAGYIYDVSNAKTSPSQARSQVALFKLASDGPEREQISRSKPSVKMKARPLYLKGNMQKVVSRSELRLVKDSELDDPLLNRWISRTIRSIPHSPGQGVKLRQASLHNKDTTAHQSDRTAGVSKGSNGKEKSFGEHVASAVGNVVSLLGDSDDTDGFIDADYYNDYQHDGHVQDDLTQDKLEAFEAALYHIDEASRCPAFRCRDPMPFVHRVGDPHDSSRVYVPECVLLHRCMNYTGCCGDGNECVPKSMNIVTEAFLMVDRFTELGDHVMFHPSLATTLTFVNHTECECRKKPRSPKCTKTCPQTFRRSQEGAHCKCDCFPLADQDSRPCQSVRDGLVPLAQDDLTCIKNDNCYTPQCTVGEFDIKTGFCPLTDEYALPAVFFQNPEERQLYREHLVNYDFTKPLTKHADTDIDEGAGSIPAKYSGFHDYKNVADGKVSRRRRAENTAETAKIHSGIKNPELPSATMFQYSALDARRINANSISLPKNEINLSAESKDINTDSSLSFVTSTPEAKNHNLSIFDTDNKVNLKNGINASYENVTNILNKLNVLSPVTAKTNENFANAKEAKSTHKERTFDNQISNDAVYSKIMNRKIQSTPSTLGKQSLGSVKNLVPTLTLFLLGFRGLDISSATYEKSFNTPDGNKLLSVENSESNLLKNILKLQAASHIINENYGPATTLSTPYAVSEDVKTSSEATLQSTSTFTPPSSPTKLPKMLFSLYPHAPPTPT